MRAFVLLLLATAVAAQTRPLVDPGTEAELLFDGATFTEGPAAAPDGSIYFSDITASARTREGGHILRYDPSSGRTSVYRSPSGMANGIVFDGAGRMIVAEGADFGGRRVTRTELETGRAEVLASLFEGRAFNSPNDVAVDPAGRIWFSDPRYVGREPIEQPVQGVYRIDPDGSVHLAVADAEKPNGVAVSPDGRTLYVAATNNGATGPVAGGMRPAEGRMAILAYEITSDGSAEFRRVVVDLRGRGFADGLSVDAEGTLWCGCGPLGVRAFTPEGREVAAVAIPRPATNVEFGRGSDGGTLYVTAGGALYRVRTRARGWHPGD